MGIPPAAGAMISEENNYQMPKENFDEFLECTNGQSADHVQNHYYGSTNNHESNIMNYVSSSKDDIRRSNDRQRWAELLSQLGISMHKKLAHSYQLCLLFGIAQLFLEQWAEQVHLEQLT